MSPYCVGCKRTVDVLVIGDWVPLIALCPDCVTRFGLESGVSPSTRNGK